MFISVFTLLTLGFFFLVNEAGYLQLTSFISKHFMQYDIANYNDNVIKTTLLVCFPPVRSSDPVHGFMSAGIWPYCILLRIYLGGGAFMSVCVRC